MVALKETTWMSILNKIIWKPLQNNQYIREAVPKKTIYIHHTAGSASPYGVLKWWNKTPARVGTAFIIGGKPTRRSHNWKDGELIQAFSSKYWAWHLGVKKSVMPPSSESSRLLNSQSIGIELCNWGYLEKRGGRFYTYINSVIPSNEVVTIDPAYRGHRYWHRYTDAQIETLQELIEYLAQTYDIPTCYKGDQMFELDLRAFEGESGIWTHTSVRAGGEKGKTDCSPQPHLIDMLKRVGGTND